MKCGCREMLKYAPVQESRRDELRLWVKVVLCILKNQQRQLDCNGWMPEFHSTDRLIAELENML